MELVWNGETVADIPLDPLADEAPLYERPYAIPKAPEPLTDIPESTDIAADLLRPVHPVIGYLAPDLGRAAHGMLTRFVPPTRSISPS